MDQLHDRTVHSSDVPMQKFEAEVCVLILNEILLFSPLGSGDCYGKDWPSSWNAISLSSLHHFVGGVICVTTNCSEAAWFSVESAFTLPI